MCITDATLEPCRPHEKTVANIIFSMKQEGFFKLQGVEDPA